MGGLEKELNLCEGSRALLVRNIDVQDGVVNSAHVTVLSFIQQYATSGKDVKAVEVQFDKPNVGTRAIASSRFDLSRFPANTIPITPFEARFPVSKDKQSLEITWSTFPLTLEHGGTIHKVHGSTHDEMVVSFKGSHVHGHLIWVKISTFYKDESTHLRDL